MCFENYKNIILIYIEAYGDEIIEIVNTFKYLEYGAQTKTNYSLKILHIFLIRRLKQYLQYKIIVLRDTW